jgi:hypothetical protein
MTDTFDPSILAALAEEFDPSAVAETEDYKPQSGFSLRLPGEYVNPHRSIIYAKKDDEGHFLAQLSLDGGVADESGRVTDTNFPLKVYIDSRPSKFAAAGSTTSLAEYFRSVGLNPTGRSLTELIALLPETLAMPASFYGTWVDRRREEPVGSGNWLGGKLRARDFQTGGDRANPIYSENITKDGVAYRAKFKVSRFISPKVA